MPVKRVLVSWELKTLLGHICSFLEFISFISECYQTLIRFFPPIQDQINNTFSHKIFNISLLPNKISDKLIIFGLFGGY